MGAEKIKIVIGFITYGKMTSKYLPYFLESLSKQSFRDFKISAIDNSEEENNENSRFIKMNYPLIDLGWPGSNIGFASAHNKMIKKAGISGAEYYLAINPDVILEADALERMMDCFEYDSDIGSVSPKIYKWDFPGNNAAGKGKTKIIDSFGIKMRPGLQFTDMGQGEIDEGQFDDGKIIGASGAAALYDIKAIDKIKEGENYFDENMFMYKEDCDIAFRLFLGGFNSKLAINSHIYHDRTVPGEGEGKSAVIFNRFKKNKKEKEWSFLNQHIMFMKFWHRQGVIAKINILIYALEMFIFVLLFEQYLLKQYRQLFKIRKLIKIY